MVASDEAVGRSFIDSFEDTPVVLMSDSACTHDVMRAVQLGAVDFLDKPLSLLKLKNIWQHSVRKVREEGGGKGGWLGRVAALLEACRYCKAQHKCLLCLQPAPADTARPGEPRLLQPACCHFPASCR